MCIYMAKKLYGKRKEKIGYVKMKHVIAQNSKKSSKLFDYTQTTTLKGFQPQFILKLYI